MASAPKYFDRVLETSTTTGTGTYTLAGAVSGYQSFGAVGDGNSCYYCAMNVDGNNNPSGGWEVGLGTYTLAGTTFSRDTVLASSNGGAAVNWAAGTRRLFLVLPATLHKGALLGVQVITATGAGTYTPTAGTNSIIIELLGGGAGGGASTAPAASRTSAGIGGGAGGWLRKRLTANFSGASYSVGAKGAGGAAGAHDGVAGGNTTFTDTTPTTYTATGGTAGPQGSTGNLLPVSFPGVAGGVATTGDINQQGGHSSFSTSTANQSVGSRGGDSMYGRGGLEVFSVLAENKTGNNATGKGAGGGGGLSTASSGGTGAAGGDGTDGMIIIYEYS